ncbi:riboflavin biosynthesis protein RibD [Azospirillum sp. RWY-5-1]|uniref:Riboflavin biosynthesis protein RibD n=1 Tax=Azospirillum oleiclasticum TaxID=2735135 RepID=A0ABX2TJ94_9PROT|nr:dihydrofolate reductase family protein [Azospirillum oleiclasticum]NYZ14499.1 riboflavin biosynthesis protein RibD [Azospirillum oleiclasticum]NYZ23149.1 riboflavin biosynthesis protein RibD [Azospirillum oleiclasticum]
MTAACGRMVRLFPAPPEEVAVEGTWLADRLHEQSGPERPFVYASFVCSLDGRIALRDPATGTGRLPAVLASASDFRLLLELQAQADCVITHAGYMRDIAAGRLDDILQVGRPEPGADLARWRLENGLSAQPAVVIASASLDFTVPSSLARNGQRVIVATGHGAPADRLEALRRQGHEVIEAGDGSSVEGGPLVRALGLRGFRSLYLLAGPRLFDTALRDGVLSRLYLTTTHRLLGGEAFDTMLAGPALGDAGVRLRLSSLHYDPMVPDGPGQCFTRLEGPAATAS